MHGSEYRSVLSCARTVFQTEGLAAFYISYPTTLTMTVPFTAAQFTVYEYLKKVLNPGNEYSPSSHMVSGGLAGAVAAGLTTPLDVLKTRLMLATTKECAVGVTGRIWREEGAAAFFSGLGPRTMWISIGGAVFLGSYQWASNMLGGV